MASIALRPDEEKLFQGQPKGFPFGDFDISDVMLPEGDDMDIPSDDDEVQEEDVQTDSGFGNVLVVDNLPKVGPEKFDKLTQILTKIFSSVGRIREGGMYHPVDKETNASKGYAFVEYETPDAARAGRDTLNGYQLDKQHKFATSLFDDFDRLARVPEEWQDPEPKPYEGPADLQWWLTDRRGRDQFVVRYGDETEVHWNDPARQQGEEVHKRSFWSEGGVEWSPRGTMLATSHRQGVAVWVGPDFKRLMRFSHPHVQRFQFSPCEKYLVCYSEIPPEGPRGRPQFLLNVFEVRTGKKLRSFDGPQDEFAVGAAALPDDRLVWPAFKWSGGDAHRFLAHMRKNGISVYEAPEMGMLDKKTVKFENVQAFEWSPTEPVLCAYQGEQGNLPARVVLVAFPEKAELRQKNLFSVAGLKLSWHPQGDYLAVTVDKYTKTRKSTTTNFELFSLREKDVPIDMLELPNKSEKIVQLAWEPKGTRFAILHGEGTRPSVSVYNMRDSKSSARGVVHLTTMANKQCSDLRWSPNGRFLVLAGLKHGLNGVLEFWDVEENALMSAGEHFMATECEWDPTGRYVATSVTAQNQMENGYDIWSFAGQLLYKTPRDRFFQFQWRPRPPSLLSEEKLREIAKGLKKYSKRYDEEDEAMLMQADTEFLAEREKLMADWRAWHESRKAWAEQQRQFFIKSMGDRYQPEESEYVVEEVEVTETVDVKEEPAKL